MSTPHIDEKTLGELKEKLKKEKVTIEGELSSFAKKNENLKGDWKTQYKDDVGDDLDENAHEVTTYATNVSLEHTLETRLKNIDDALERMASGTYGLCETDGKPMPIERLLAKPEARVCLDHREE